jgi:hypothetical protein
MHELRIYRFALAVSFYLCMVQAITPRLCNAEDEILVQELPPLPERYPWFNPLILAVLVFVVWLFYRRRWPTRIVVDRNGVRSHRGLPKSREREILAFLNDDVSFEGKVTIGLARSQNGSLQTHFAGRIDEGTRQRIRNYLITVL